MLTACSGEKLAASVEGCSETAKSLSQVSCNSHMFWDLLAVSEQAVGCRGSPEVSSRTGSLA